MARLVSSQAAKDFCDFRSLRENFKVEGKHEFSASQTGGEKRYRGPEKTIVVTRLGKRQIGHLKFRRQHPFGHRVVDSSPRGPSLPLTGTALVHFNGRGQTTTRSRDRL